MVGALAKEERTTMRAPHETGKAPETGDGAGSRWQFWRWGQTNQEMPTKHTPIDPALLIDGNSTTASTSAVGVPLLEGEWTKEASMVHMRLREFQEAKFMAQLNRHISAKSNWFVV